MSTCRQSPISKRTTPAIWQAIRMFMVGEDGISGAALVELTLFAPMLLVGTVYILDYGLFFFKQMEVQNAAQASAQYAIVNAIRSIGDRLLGKQHYDWPAFHGLLLRIIVSPLFSGTRSPKIRPVLIYTGQR